MFTGIINHMGLFKGYRKGKQEMALEAATLSSRIEIGESLSVNGVCLSLIKKEKNILFFNLAQETIERTNLGSLRPGVKLNLELPLTLSSPLSGHLITGHIDSRGKVVKIVQRQTGKRVTVSFPTELRKYFIPIENSNLGESKRGDDINIECDMIGKYVYNWISQGKREK